MNDIRYLQPTDVPEAMHLSRAAGWNQTEDDWRRVISTAPDGCFCIRTEGRLVATTTAVCYGQELAWIGMVLTDPDYRGRGYARRLMKQALEYVAGRDVAWIKLDATDMGRPLYSSLGFEDECIVERWWRGGAQGTSAGWPGNTVLPLDLDAAAFGADRSDLLAKLSPYGCVAGTHGYAMWRPGEKALYFGPCVARQEEEGRMLFDGFLSAHGDQDIFWDLLPGNSAAVRLASAAGFECRRRLTRMTLKGRGNASPPGNNDQYVYAIAGFEYG